jgi:hypothetical protein
MSSGGELYDIILSEVRKTQKTKSCMPSLICGIRPKGKNRCSIDNILALLS